MVVLKPGPDPDLKAFLRPFGNLFVCPENRFACQCYLLGLLSERPRQNCDRMAVGRGHPGFPGTGVAGARRRPRSSPWITPAGPSSCGECVTRSVEIEWGSDTSFFTTRRAQVHRGVVQVQVPGIAPPAAGG